MELCTQDPVWPLECLGCGELDLNGCECEDDLVCFWCKKSPEICRGFCGERNRDMNTQEATELSHQVGIDLSNLIATQDFDAFIASMFQLAATIASYRRKDHLALYIHEAMKGWQIEMGMETHYESKGWKPHADT